MKKLMSLFMTFVIVAFTALPIFAGTVIIESWRNDDADAWNDKIIPAFNAQHPDIEVVFQATIPAQYSASISAKLEGGNAGDLITLIPFDASLKLFNRGWLASLNDLGGLDNYPQVAKDAWSTDDQSDLFGVPMASVSHGFMYNKDIFKELGLSVPKTESEFFSVLEKIKSDGNYIPLAIGTADTWAISTMGFQNIGPNYWEGEKGRKGILTGDEKFTDDHYVSLFETLGKWSNYMADGYQAQTYPDSQNLFTLGDAAIYPTGSWEIFTFSQNADFEFSAFAPPTRDGQSNCFIDDHTDIGIGLNSKAKNPEEAKVFLEWLTGAEFAEIFANEVPGFFPLHSHSISVNDPVAKEFISWKDTCDTTIRNSYHIVGRGEPNLESVLYEVVSGVVNGTVTPAEAAERAEASLANWYEPHQ
jgi:raffinose/stachyose/melibiose transport system substrate-binding protein